MTYLTIGGQMDRSDGFGHGFGFARLFLSVTILCWHGLVIGLKDRSYFDLTFFWGFNYCLVPMFFALSGFLIGGSANRLSIRAFFGNRAARILPALAVEVFLSAVFLGPLVSAFVLRSYFGDPQFLNYFFNLIGVVQYELPGVVFEQPYPHIVNGSLWTVPIEMLCYATMGLLLAIKLQHRYFMTLVLAFACAEFIAVATSGNFPAVVSFLAENPYFRFVFNNRGAALLPCFLLGLSVYNLRSFIPYDKRIFFLCILFPITIGCLAGPGIIIHPIFLPILCMMWTYIIIFVGVSDLRFLSPRGDYSYGIYLYHFPILQVAAKYLPWANPILLICAGLTLTVIFAFLSWHAIERPILKVRRSFVLLRSNTLQ